MHHFPLEYLHIWCISCISVYVTDDVMTTWLYVTDDVIKINQNRVKAQEI